MIVVVVGGGGRGRRGAVGVLVGLRQGVGEVVFVIVLVALHTAEVVGVGVVVVEYQNNS